MKWTKERKKNPWKEKVKKGKKKEKYWMEGWGPNEDAENVRLHILFTLIVCDGSEAKIEIQCPCLIHVPTPGLRRRPN